MELSKRSDLTARKIKVPEEELLQIIDKYVKRVELAMTSRPHIKLMVPLGPQNIETFKKIVKEKLGVEIECVPVTSANNLYAVTIKNYKKIKY
jgi:hypothetical protein